MKTNQLRTPRRGMTLIEMTVAIMVLLMFVGLLLIAAKAWKRGSDRAACLMNIRNVQQALRGYANTNELEVGASLVPPDAPHESVIGPGNFVAVMPHCPADGLYGFSGAVVPPVGTLFMTCSLSGSANHEPDDFGSW